jgi:transposase InsO family protein
MTDFSPGPYLHPADGGKALPTFLCVIIDDHSRLIPYAAYYLHADTQAFHQTLKEAVRRRGLPAKLYTDQGGPFTNDHTRIVCANLGIRLLHAKPYHAWSKGKQERWFSTLPMDFEARLIIEPAHTLEELNARLWRWIESEYHQRPHSALDGQTPAERFVQRALNLRVADALGRAPQLHDCHLDQALLVLVLAMKRARRSPRLRYPRRPDYREPDLPF